jgi:heme oxygenase
VTPLSYCEFLRAMAFLHEALEGTLAGCPEPVVGQVWGRDLARLPALRKDLGHLDPAGSAPVGRAELMAILAGEEARIGARRDPLTLLGWLYVLQGAALGGLALTEPVGKALGMGEGVGLAFLSGGGEKPARGRWGRFARRMETAVAGEAAAQSALEGAHEAFRATTEIFQALEPEFSPGTGLLTPVLNREAGTHRIPQDPREIQAALRAGAVSWERFPYYELRYGSRGRRFTRSDSAWIVTLAGESGAVAEHQLRWLGRFLASRGMPRWLLELHLEELHRELVAVRPERAEGYGVLLGVARTLREERLRILDRESIHLLTRRFEAEVPPAELAGLPWAPHILVAAVADEMAGISGSIRSVEVWMRDRARFSEAWASGVRDLLDRARERARPLRKPSAAEGTPSAKEEDRAPA